jgi:anaerobic ribonucleoside-triphosphate reductase activating protein
MPDLIEIRLNRPVRYGITTLGYGSRIAIWLQGCTLACPGCVSRDTWAARGGSLLEAEALADMILTAAGDFDGLTISGGEPFQQAEALGELLRLVRAGAPEEFDVLCYSGYLMRRLRSWYPQIVGLLDVLVDGPFRIDEPTLLPWRGSGNQVLHRLTPLAERRYADADVPVPRPRLQVVSLDDREVELAGIPAAGALEAIAAGFREEGFELRGASWL